MYKSLYFKKKGGDNLVMNRHVGNKAWEDYGYWLMERVGFKRKRYENLLLELHYITFHYSIGLDGNRVSDGLELREEYALENDMLDVKFKDAKCSVLEVLTALAIRIEYEYIGDPREEHPEKIFWEMIENLFNIERNWRLCGPEIDRQFVHYTVEKWLNRGFEPDGRGSIFPLKNPDCDQTEIEIWSQMNRYLMENYPI